MSVFALPDLGEGLQDAEVVAWHVSEGEHVVADQPLVSVETAKAVVEIPSPHAGHITRLGARVGDRLRVGAPLVEFEEGVHADSGTVVGVLGGGASVPAANAPATGGADEVSRPTPRAAPVVRARARILGVELAKLSPSGPDGTVTMADVERAAAGGTLRGARHTMAINMAHAWASVAHATITEDVDVDAWTPSGDVTARLVRAIVAGCDAVPKVNAWYDSAATSLAPQSQIDLGLAIDTGAELLVPVLRDVRGKSLQELRTLIDAAKAMVLARRLEPQALRGQTITLSNFGTLAGLHAALLIMPPQVAILGAGRIAPRVVAHDGAPAIRRTLPLSLTFDHRALTGGDAARFLAATCADLARLG